MFENTENRTLTEFEYDHLLEITLEWFKLSKKMRSRGIQILLEQDIIEFDDSFNLRLKQK